MKAFLVIPTLTAGGAERVMSIIANIWSEYQDLEVHIVLLADDEIFYELRKNIIVHKLYFPIKPSIISRIINLIKLAYRFRKLTNKHAPEFILSFMNKYNVFVLLSLIGQNRKVFVSERDGSTEKIPVVRRILRDFTYKWARGVIAQTNVGKEFIKNTTGNKNVIVIPNPIREVINYQIPKEKIILNVGRLVEKKGQKYLLDAFANAKIEGWQLVFLGEGPLRQELELQAKRLGISHLVNFVGTVKDVDIWLSKSEIFCFPSILEGFPNALAEAMIAGLPCISFNCDSGPSDLIIDGENGFLVEVGDVTELEKKIQMLCENETIRMYLSNNARLVRQKLDANYLALKFYKFCIE